MKRTLFLSLLFLSFTHYTPEASSLSVKKNTLLFPTVTSSIPLGANLVVEELPKVTPIKDREAKKEFQLGSHLTALYQQIGLEKMGLSKKAFEHAMIGYYNLEGKLKQKDIISIVDFDQASTKERLYVIDIKQKKVLHQSLVAHGKNSGWNMASNFGNAHRSLKSNLGFMVTAETYFGKFGYALRFDGQERGFNSNARSRGIVMHGANYVNPEFVKQRNRLGRSYGCPALPYGIHKRVINTIKGGSLFYIHKSNKAYEQGSKLLNKTKAEAVAKKLHAANLNVAI